MGETSFTPALGRPELTASYDRAIRWLTREKRWRTALLRQLAPSDGETILDVGCGTGTFAIMVKRAAPGAHVIGMDLDPEVLALAAAKAAAAGVDIRWDTGSAADAASHSGRIDKLVSSLVLHQVPVGAKVEGIAAMLSAARPGGEVHIADYARQRGRLMRTLFRLTVQRLDGRADTQPNADGMLEAIIAEAAGSAAAVPTLTGATPTGAISLFRIVKAAARLPPRSRVQRPL